MNARPWLLVSLGLNFLLAFLWLTRPQPAPPPAPIVVPGAAPPASAISTVRYENFTWDEIESTNRAQFIKSLRAIGCPEERIRDLVIADVEREFRRRRANEIVAPDYQWWRAEPEPDVVQAAAAKARQLAREQHDLLTTLLGPGWDAEDNLDIAARAGISLTGPVLGDLSQETKDAVCAAVADSQKKIDAYLQAQAQANKPADPMELARLRQNFLTGLVTLLDPESWTEFALRYSQGAQQLRQQLRGTDLTPAQFTAAYQALSPMLDQPVYYYAGGDPQLLSQQQTLQAAADAALKNSLGAGLYLEYQLDQDPTYVSSKAQAQDLGAPAEEVQPIYEINRATQQELDRIRGDADMTPDEKVEAMAQTQVEQEEALEQLLGPQIFQRWLTGQAAAPSK